MLEKIKPSLRKLRLPSTRSAVLTAQRSMQSDRDSSSVEVSTIRRLPKPASPGNLVREQPPLQQRRSWRCGHHSNLPPRGCSYPAPAPAPARNPLQTHCCRHCSVHRSPQLVYEVVWPLDHSNVPSTASPLYPVQTVPVPKEAKLSNNQRFSAASLIVTKCRPVTTLRLRRRATFGRTGSSMNDRWPDSRSARR